MKFKNDTLEQIENLSKYYVEISKRKRELIHLLKDQILDIDLSEVDKIKSPPEFSFAKFIDDFSTFPVQNKDNLEYSILAVDGSRIEMQEGFPLPFYVINVSSVFEIIGKNHRHIEDSETQVYFRENDIYDSNGNFITEQDIDLNMLLQEAEFLAQKIKIHKPDISLVDGSLILWGLKKTATNEQEAIRKYEKPIIETNNARKAIAGFISGTRSREVIKTMGLYFRKKNVQLDEKDKQLLRAITDAELMSVLLEENQRTSLFISTEKLLSNYSNRIYFFFLKTKYEVVRIEVPDFLYENKQMFENLCSLILYEIERGQGYPLILKLAHFGAVISENEKRFLEDYVRKRMIDSRRYSEKLASKLKRKI